MLTGARLTHDEETELQALRQRAYGRNSDIEIDPGGLARLRELEARASDAGTLSAEEPRPPAEQLDEDQPEEVKPSMERSWARIKVSRSTLMILLGLAVVGAVLATALTLVQRVQVDPLLSGAKQVARLSPDASYQIPLVFAANASTSGPHVRAYQAFHGLRVLLNSNGFVSQNETAGTCLSIYPEADIVDASSDSFSGTVFGGCAAGRFPPATQVSFDDVSYGDNVHSLPPDLKSSFPRAQALQFIYDKASDEVVVFVDR